MTSVNSISPLTSLQHAHTTDHELPEYVLDADAKFWFQICGPALAGMMDFAGTYSPEEKKGNLRFFAEQVCPWIGPRPARSSDQDTSGSPYEASTPVEMSVNFSSTRKPIVRFQLEPTRVTKGQHVASEEPLVIDGLLKVLESTESLPGVNLNLVRQLLQSMVPSERQDIATLNAAVRDGRLPAPLDHVTHLQVAFDLDGTKRSMKTYYNPMAMQLATGKNIRDVAFNAIEGLQPYGRDLAVPLGVVGDFMKSSPDVMEVLMTGVDAADPATARIKLYTYLRDANSWECVRRAWTLGGAAADDEDRMTGLALLRSIWPLLMDEAATPWSRLETLQKPPRVSLSFLGTLLLTYEFRHDTRVPDVKLYLPLWQYAPTDRRIADNVAEILRTLGWGEAADGYMAHLQRTFPGANLDGPAALHSYLSFSYSRKTGPYLSLYYAIHGKAVNPTNEGSAA
ncbi:tryptophan dimethylallyltransferase domain-containing protein [Apiospora kogelbergensis]|uniref:Tryptophan dimethylallyltransferase domain-containing protein n=1 Tax=Apiospora kogelbergensis TaxID=1337665 RepID=A0AAW0REL4_9PEZI